MTSRENERAKKRAKTRKVGEMSLARAMDAARVAQTGVDAAGEEILKGVYELERKPDGATRARLAKQIGCGEQAVNAWFRSRRAKAKRVKMNRALLWTMLVAGLVAGIYFAVNASRQTMAARRRRDELGDNYKHMTRSGLPRPYADQSNKYRVGGSRERTQETVVVVDAAGRERVVPKQYTRENAKTSPLTKPEETPRQTLERVRADAAAKRLGKSTRTASTAR